RLIKEEAASGGLFLLPGNTARPLHPCFAWSPPPLRRGGSTPWSVAQHVALDRDRETILVVGQGHGVGGSLDRLGGIPHRDGKPRGGKHFEIVLHVAENKDLLARNTEP